MEIKNATVPALERALNVIEYLAMSENAVSLKQLSTDLDIPASSAFRLIKNLSNRGYVQEISNGQTTYILGTKIMNLADRYRLNAPLQAIAKPFMMNLAKRLEQTVQLALLKQNSVVYIEQALSSAQVNIIAPLYEPISINQSASGKILIAHLSEQEAKNIIKNVEYKKATDKTITDSGLFDQEIKKCRQLGYAVDNEEYSYGIGCLAVPILNYNNICIAALGITGTIQNYQNKKSFDFMLKNLREAADDISAKLGH